MQKALLKDQNGKSFVLKITEEYTKVGFEEIVIVSNPDNVRLIEAEVSQFNSRIILNNHVNKGRMFSVSLGVRELSKKTEYCFMQDVDRPLINQRILSTLIDIKKPGYYSSLTYKNKKGHPIVLSQEIFLQLCDPKNTDKVLSSFLRQFPSNHVPIDDPGILININTKEDYRANINAAKLHSN